MGFCMCPSVTVLTPITSRSPSGPRTPPRINRVIDKLQLDVVDTGEAELVADVQKGQSQPVPEKETIETEHGAVSFAVGESEEQFNMDFTPAPKQSDLETTALGRKNPSEPSSPNKGPLPDTPSPARRQNQG